MIQMSAEIWVLSAEFAESYEVRRRKTMTLNSGLSTQI
jgi:hypothetical protein